MTNIFFYFQFSDKKTQHKDWIFRQTTRDTGEGVLNHELPWRRKATAVGARTQTGGKCHQDLVSESSRKAEETSQFNSMRQFTPIGEKIQLTFNLHVLNCWRLCTTIWTFDVKLQLITLMFPLCLYFCTNTRLCMGICKIFIMFWLLNYHL